MENYCFGAGPTTLSRFVKTQIKQVSEELKVQPLWILKLDHTGPGCTQTVKRRTVDGHHPISLLKERR